MAKALMLAWTSPVGGADEEFLHWYDTVHIPDIRTAVPSVENVTRYRLTGPDADGPSRYLVIYELADGDTDAVMAAVGAAAADGRMELTPLLDTTGHPPVMQFYKPA